MKKLLITGFDPFGGQTINPAWEAVRLLPDAIGEYELCKLQIPTVFGTAAQTVLAEAERLLPDVIISVGQAGGRSAVTPERIGINLRDARIPDNAGNQPADIPICPGGPDGIFATVPVGAMVRSIADAGLPAAVSNTAGTFVCNDVLYNPPAPLRRHRRSGGVHPCALPPPAGYSQPAAGGHRPGSGSRHPRLVTAGLIKNPPPRKRRRSRGGVFYFQASSRTLSLSSRSTLQSAQRMIPLRS